LVDGQIIEVPAMAGGNFPLEISLEDREGQTDSCFCWLRIGINNFIKYKNMNQILRNVSNIPLEIPCGYYVVCMMNTQTSCQIKVRLTDNNN
jgi:hypothetical protein